MDWTFLQALLSLNQKHVFMQYWSKQKVTNDVKYLKYYFETIND